MMIPIFVRDFDSLVSALQGLAGGLWLGVGPERLVGMDGG